MERLTRPQVLLGAGAMMLMIASAIAWIPRGNPDPLNAAVGQGFGLMVVGGVLLWVALFFAKQGTDQPQVDRFQTAVLRRGWHHHLMMAVGVMLLLLAAEITVRRYVPEEWSQLSHHIQFLIWLVGVVLVVWGMMGPGQGGGLRINRQEGLTIVGITLLSLFLNFWGLGEKIRVLIDEMHTIIGVLAFWDDHHVPILSPISNTSPYPRLFPYFQTWTIELFGRDLEGLRAVSAVMGTLTVVSVWWMVRHFYNRSLALLAALLLATFPPQIHFSRIALVNAADPFVGTALLAFLARGWQTGARRDFVLAGLMLGMTQYFFEGGRLLFPAVLLVWIIVFGWQMRNNLLNLFVTGFIVGFPAYYGLNAINWQIDSRLESSGHSPDYWLDFVLGRASAEELRTFLEQVVKTFTLYVNWPEIRILYSGTQPLILAFLVPFFLLGIWHLFWRGLRGHAPSMLPLIWVLGTSLGNVLLVESDVSVHYIMAFPALALVIAAGLYYTVELLIGRMGRRRVMIWLALVVAIMQVVYYFFFHIPYFNVQYRDARNHRDLEDGIFRAADSPPGTRIYFIMERKWDAGFNANLMGYLRDGVHIITYDNEAIDEMTFADYRDDMSTGFLLVPHDQVTLDLIERWTSPLTDPQFSSNPDVPDYQQYVFYFLEPVQFSTPTDFAPRNRRHGGELSWMLMGGVVLAAAGFGWYRIQNQQPDRRPVVGLPRLLAAAGLIGFAQLYHALCHHWVTMVLRLLLGAGGILLLVLLTFINLGAAPAQSIAIQVMLFIMGALLVGVSGEWRISVGTMYATSTDRDWAFHPTLTIGLILLLAFVLRVVNLNGMRRFVDEVLSATSVVELQDDPQIALLVPFKGVPAFTRLYGYGQHLMVDVLGPSLMSLRLLSGVVGTLTVAAVYLLARIRFSRLTALLAALALAVFPPHIHFSRIALNNIADPLFGTLALAFLFGGRYALAGVMLGLTQYFYEGGRLLFPVLVLLVAMIVCRKQMTVGDWLRFGFAAVIVAAPVYVILFIGDFPLTPRLDHTVHASFYWKNVIASGFPGGVNLVLDNMHTAARLFYTVPDSSWFYGGQTPLILLPLLPIMILGLLHLRQSHFIWLWLLLTIAGNSLLVEKTESPRFVVAFPAIALAMGLGWSTLLRLLARFEMQQVRWRYAATVLVGVFVIGQVAYYFGVHVPRFPLQSLESTQIDDVRLRAMELPDYTYVEWYTNTPQFDTDSYSVMRFFERHQDNVFINRHRANDDNLLDLLDNLIPNRNYAFFVSPENTAMLDILEASPAVEGPFLSPDDGTVDGLYWMYFAESEVQLD